MIPLLSMKFGLNKYARNKQRTTLKYAGDKPCGNFEYQHGREQDDMRLGTLFFSNHCTRSGWLPTEAVDPLEKTVITQLIEPMNELDELKSFGV